MRLIVPVEWTQSVPRPAAARPGSGMVELGAGHSSVRLEESDNPREWGDLGLLPNAKIRVSVAADGIDRQPFCHDGTGSAYGKLRQVLKMPIGRPTISTGGIDLHRRNHTAIAQGDLPQPQRREKPALCR